MDVVVATDPEQAAIDAAVHELRIAMLLAARIEADQAELRCAIERAAPELASFKSKEKQ